MKKQFMKINIIGVCQNVISKRTGKMVNGQFVKDGH